MELIWFGTMTGNRAVIDKAFKGFEKQILSQTEERLKSWCYDLMVLAYKNRLSNPRAHDFTGNLINSIMVGLYRKGNPTYVCIVGDRGVVKAPITGKMSIRSNGRPQNFKEDWSGDKSSYSPTVSTNRGNGVRDASEFFRSYRPSGRNAFDVVVAYPVEYASWVEQERQTTGYLQTLADAKATGITFMELKSA